ncbi:MAG: hypothetical protein IT164_16820 [Bryobacterales bacterium]|nr:hypothetical protein [Bryobacterales bacterium]
MIRRIALAALLALLFWIANRGAYRGFFSGDDLDNLAWTRPVPGAVFAKALLSPVYTANNFRPTGHGLYHLWSHWFGTNFPPYVATIQALHLLNALLLFLLLRRAGLEEWPALAGTLFWTFHMALFGAFWRPMYVFDVLCGLFTLGALLAWSSPRWPRAGWLISFLCFWLAMKSKEHAVLLPLVLLAWEWSLGRRRWKPLIPFFAAALAIGLQGVFANKGAGEDYRLHFSPSSLISTLWRYAPYLWFIALPAAIRSNPLPRPAGWGGWFCAILLLPLLALPVRVYPVYLYVPLMGLSVVAATMAAALPRRWMAAAVVLWLGVNFAWMRELRRAELTVAGSNRAYWCQLRDAPSLADPEIYVYDGYPEGLDWWGISGAIRVATGKLSAPMAAIQTEGLLARVGNRNVMQLTWNEDRRELHTVVRSTSNPELPMLDMRQFVPFWQLGEGWYKQESNYRWTKPKAWATLRKPAGASRFLLRVNIGPDYIRAVGHSRVRVLLDGAELGQAGFDRQGWQSLTWPVVPSPAATVKVEIEVTPPFRPGPSDPRELGVAVGALGFPDTPR